MKTYIRNIKNLPKMVILALNILSLGSCTHYYYAPNCHNVPLFQKKGDVRLSLVGSEGSEFTGTEVQAAYSVSSRIAVIADGFWAKEKNAYENSRAKGNYFETACGYYKPIRKHFVFETYGGMGLGNIKSWYHDYGYSEMFFSKYFLQPSFGFTSKNFDIALSSRLCGLNYSEIRDLSISDDKGNIDFIKGHSLSYLVEPALTMRLGWKNLKLQLQYSLSRNMTYRYFPQESGNLNIALFVSL
jgi:hypothetical protein